MEIVDIPERVDVPRDGRGSPVVVPEHGGYPITLTRTTTFIDAVEDKTGLTNWKVRSVAEYLSRDPEFAEQMRVALAAQEYMSQAWKRVADEYCEKAMDKSGANEKREKGTQLHYLTELVDQNLPLPDGLTDEDIADMGAYMMATLDFDIKHIEKFVVCSELGVGGTPDRVSLYSGPGPNGLIFEDALLITDLKTGTLDYGTAKMAAQLSIYSRAKVYDHTRFPVMPLMHKTTGKPLKDDDGKKALAAWKKIAVDPAEAALAYTPLGPIRQDWGVVFNMRPGSGLCEPYWVDLSIGWEQANLAQTVRTARKVKDALIPFD